MQSKNTVLKQVGWEQTRSLQASDLHKQSCLLRAETMPTFTEISGAPNALPAGAGKARLALRINWYSLNGS